MVHLVGVNLRDYLGVPLLGEFRRSITLVRELVISARKWANSHTGKKLIRYTMVSVITTIFSLTVLLLVFGVFQWWGQLGSTIFANEVAIVPSYYLNRRWAWGKTGRSHWGKEVLPFVTMSQMGIFVSMVGALYARHLDTQFHMSHLEATLVVLVANVLSFGIFWVLKLLLFNRLFKFSELDEFDEHLTLEEQGKR